MAPTRPARRFILTFAAAAAALIVLANATAHAQTETLPFIPVADCYVDASLPTTTFNDVSLKLDGKPVKISYLRFVVTGVNGRAVQQARLRLAAGTATVAGGSVHAISNHTWSETAATYDTRPAVDGPALGTLGALAVGDIADFDLGSAVVGDGTYDFALDSTNSDGVTYGSSTATGQKPTLVLTVAAAGTNPSVAILQPQNGAGFFVGDQVTFQGSASDPQDGPLSASISWSSDRDGALGTGASVTKVLTQGSHLVTASVTDSDAHPASAQVQVTVAPAPPANTAPLVTITAPVANQTLSAATPITFSGTANDLEQGSLTTALQWTSSLDGALGTGGSITHTLSAGTHTITARATDNANVPGTATVVVNVTVPTVLEFTPTVDAYVDAGSTSKNFGTTTLLRVDANTERISYLRFAVAGIGARPITHAVLRLQVDSVSGAQGDKGGDVHTISDTSWSETGITYANRPAVDGPTIGTRTTAVALNQVIDFDLGNAISGDGTKSFAITNPSSDGVDYRSRESATPPKLILTLGGNAPQVAITAPPTGGVVVAGTTVNFTATATDVEDGDVAAQVHWTSSLDGALNTGAGISTSTLQIGTHTITAAVTDSSGLTGQAQVTLRVRGPNAPPTIAINTPASGASFPAGTAVTLTATASDDFDGPLSAAIQWSSSLSGALGAGASITKTLAEGAHTITASVTDSDGASKTAQITLTIMPTAPVVTITSPAANASVFEGNALAFTGSAIDATSGDLTSALQWSSSLVANPIGSGASFSLTNLPVGTQVITASASDGSLVGQAQRTITVRPPNVAPQVAIQSPIDGAALLAAKPVLLSATATDAENGNLAAVVKWTSSRDGALGTGATRTLSTLTVGTHVLTASATDLDGQTTTAQVTVTISPSTLTFNPIADTYVDASGTTKSFGTATTMTADGSPVKQILMRFQVAGIGAFAVDQAHLLLQTGTASAASSKAGGTVQRFDDHTWTETTTYATRPTITGPVLATNTSAVKANKPVDFNVTSGVAADGALELALVTTNSDDVIYQSREGSKKPQLVVTLKQNTGPVVTITAPPAGTNAILGAPVTFTATATDAESGNLGAQIKWTSSIDGTLGTGASLTKTTLSPGAHTITASVSDPSGASTQAQVAVTIGHPPVVTITSPANQATIFTPQLPATLTATAQDEEDGDLTNQIHWTSSLDGAIGDGGTISRALSVGAHTITAAVTDSTGVTAQPQITVRVRTPNTPPTIAISSPAPNASLPEETTWTLTAAANDDFDGPLTSQIQWTSSVGGALGIGGSLAKVLSKGPQTLTASVTDSDGVTRTAQVNVTVTLTPPVVTITAPAAGDAIFAGDALTFTATAVDATDGNLAASLTWTSDVAGAIGSGASFTTSTLAQGTHVVTASVKDSDNATGQAQRTVVVRAADAPATLTINSPANGGAAFVGKPVTFAATVDDPDDGNLSGLVHWTSDIDGAIGNGASFAVSTLSAGTHHLTASVTDLGGRTVTQTITFTVAQATMTLAAAADTYVDAGATSTKFGTDTSLIVDNSPVKQAFLRFTVSGIGSIPIAQAKLRLTTGSASAATSASGGSVHLISNSTWSEATTTYATRPAIDGAILATRATSVALNEVVEFDVTSAVTGAGTYNFALDTTSSDDVVYQSREAASGRPQLVLTLRDPDAPVITIIAPAAGTVVASGTAVNFTATAHDSHGGSLANVQWSSSIDGVLGTGASISHTLSAGTHTITASVTDNQLTTTATVLITSGTANPPSSTGTRDWAFGAGVEDGASNEATAQKPEAKLWYVDGLWWATLYSPTAAAHHIYKFSTGANAWTDTGVLVDARAASRQDVLWDGSKLYMVSRFAGSPAQATLLRYKYTSSSKTWSMDSGFPINISGGSTESMTIAKDSTGTLWIAYTLGLQVWVNHTLGNDTTWDQPFQLPFPEGSVKDDDIAGVQAMNGKIGVFWSNQLLKKDFFAVHVDGANATSWTLETAGSGGKFADDHFNMKFAADGRLFVMVKTSYGNNGEILDGLLVRSATGTWSPLFNIALVDFNPTRELILLDEVKRKIFAFYSLDHASLYYKVSDMDTIAFPDGPGLPIIASQTVTDISNPTSTKQSITQATGIMVEASSRADNSYWHNLYYPTTP